MSLHYKFSQIFALQDMTRSLYDKVQEEFRVPKLEVELEKAKKYLASLVMELATWVANTAKMRKLENYLVEIGKAMAQL